MDLEDLDHLKAWISMGMAMVSWFQRLGNDRLSGSFRAKIPAPPSDFDEEMPLYC
jgi:hypothetical protein